MFCKFKPEKLNWEIDDDCMEIIEKQFKFATDLANSVDMYILPFGRDKQCQVDAEKKGFGKRLIKKFRCSPDAYVQLALQLANYRDQVRFEKVFQKYQTLHFHNRDASHRRTRRQ